MNSSVVGNILLALSMAVAAWQFYDNKQYNLHYNTFTKLLEYTQVSKARSVIVNHPKLNPYFKNSAEITSTLIVEIRNDGSEDGLRLRAAITDLVNYYEAMCMGRATGALSKDILDKEITQTIKSDYAVLRHWYPQTEREISASYPFMPKCFAE